MNTIEVNNLRKKIFEYVREHYNICKIDVTKKFGKSKVAITAFEEAKTRKDNKNENFDYLKLFVDRNNDRLINLSKCLPNSGYSMGETKKIFFRAGDKVIGLEYDNTREYSHGCRFGARHGFVECELPARFLLAKSLAGIITRYTSNTRFKDVKKAEWVDFEAEYYYNKLYKVTPTYIQGYIVEYQEFSYYGDVVERYYHTSTWQDALKKRRRFSEKFKIEYKKRETELKRKKADDRLRQSVKRNAKKYAISILNRKFKIEDSIKAGNCVAGTMAFITRHNLNKDVVMTGRELINTYKGDSGEYYAKRIIVKAIEDKTKSTKNDITEIVYKEIVNEIKLN